MVLATLIAVFSWVFAQQPAKAPPIPGASEGKSSQVGKQENETKQGQGGTAETAPIQIDSAIFPKEQPESTSTKAATTKPNENTDIQRKIADLTGKLTLYTGLLVAVGTLQFIALVWQACVFRKTLGTLNRQAISMRRQTVSNRITANAAKKSADALMNIERAWIMLDSVEPEDFLGEVIGPGDVKPVQAIVIFKNFGSTPAWIVESTFSLKLNVNPDVFALEYGTVYPQQESVPPGEHGSGFCRLVELEPKNKLIPQEVQGIKSGKYKFFLYGFVKYRDVFFEQTKEFRFTYFCLCYFVMRLGDMGPPIGGWRPFRFDEANRNT